MVEHSFFEPFYVRIVIVVVVLGPEIAGHCRYLTPSVLRQSRNRIPSHVVQTGEGLDRISS